MCNSVSRDTCLFQKFNAVISENSGLTKSTFHEFSDGMAGYELHMQPRHHSVLFLGVCFAFSNLIASPTGFVVFFNVVLRVRHLLDVSTITDASYIHNI